MADFFVDAMVLIAMLTPISLPLMAAVSLVVLLMVFIPGAVLFVPNLLF